MRRGFVPPEPKGEPGAFTSAPVSLLCLNELIWLYCVPTAKTNPTVKSFMHDVVPNIKARETTAAKDIWPILLNFMRFLHPGRGRRRQLGRDYSRLHCKTGNRESGACTHMRRLLYQQVSGKRAESSRQKRG